MRELQAMIGKSQVFSGDAHLPVEENEATLAEFNGRKHSLQQPDASAVTTKKPKKR